MKVAVIGFQRFNEEMYPHLYDVLQSLRQNFELTYYDNDDRGEALFIISRAFRLDLLALAQFPLAFLKHIKNLIKIFEITYFGRNDVVICIDDNSYFWTSIFARKHTKIIFWSHDLICEGTEKDAERIFKVVCRKNIKNLNLKSKHSLIIQDQLRMKQLLLNHEIPQHRVMLLPVSIIDSTNSITLKNKSDNLPKLLQLSPSIIKGSKELINFHTRHPSQFNLFFHGHVPRELAEQLKELSISYSNVSSTLSLMRANIQSADIGFVSYTNSQNLNFKNLRFAFGQLVEFCNAGIPLIVFKQEDVGLFVEQHNAGVHIREIDSLPFAINKILNDFKNYQLASRRLFENYFNYKHFQDKLINFIRR